MDRLAQRLSIARKALETLAELPLEPSADAVIRDAAIQRFEYTLEAVWKAAQLYLRECEGIDLASPKGVVRACYEAEARWGMQMVDDRNLTAHTYNEELAKLIFSRLPGHLALMRRLLEALGRNV
ncbi:MULTISPECIES: HI0074 family nucleotidyltransferase substrate-binding subunit [unclassified Meiothermus]|uniref:HI0074 family nucleotidyltransferase substrate-binding subunit n=1 Tax=unclassified Meiothermus TaxID=370471 RepID=UPI000D7BB0D7|nr:MULTISPECIES: HI0074 family nucleotidyltransferase substrate-binding subunit [unclassified Meiothermus]PZA06819.1 nucleotidyltransferase [Meiothermus sp. Pnk-1]RYM33100.1 nucleotidyltransferase [Meiothermus sp. PNK-Is4]